MAKNILVLNDEENTLGSLIQELAKNGYTPYSTTNADDCVDLFETVQPAVLFLNLKTQQL